MSMAKIGFLNLTPTALILSGCISAPIERPESNIKYFVVPAQNSDEIVPRTLLSSGEVQMFVNEAGCLKLRLVDENLLRLRPGDQTNSEFIPVFFPDVIIGSDDDGFFIQHELALEKYRNRDNIIGADPIRIGETTAFGMSNSGFRGINGANRDICKGPMQGVYLNPPFRKIVDDLGRVAYQAITSAD